MKLTLASKEFLKEIEVRKYSPKTIRSYRNNLNLFLCYCAENAVEDTEDVTLGTVKGFAFFMSNLGRKGTYINSLLKAVKSFIQYCYEEEQVKNEVEISCLVSDKIKDKKEKKMNKRIDEIYSSSAGRQVLGSII